MDIKTMMKNVNNRIYRANKEYGKNNIITGKIISRMVQIGATITESGYVSLSSKAIKEIEGSASFKTVERQYNRTTVKEIIKTEESRMTKDQQKALEGKKTKEKLATIKAFNVKMDVINEVITAIYALFGSDSAAVSTEISDKYGDIDINFDDFNDIIHRGDVSELYPLLEAVGNGTINEKQFSEGFDHLIKNGTLEGWSSSIK